MNAVEADVPESKKRYLSKLGVQKEAAKPKVAEVGKLLAEVIEVTKKPEVEEAVEVKEAVKLKAEPEIKKPDVKAADKKSKDKEAVKEAVPQPEVAKSDIKEVVKKAAEKPEVREDVKKPEVNEVVKGVAKKSEVKEAFEVKEAVKLTVEETVHKPEVKRTDIKTVDKKSKDKEAVKEAVPQPEIKKSDIKEAVKKAVEKPEVREEVKKPEVKEAVKARGAFMVTAEVKETKVEEPVKVVEMKGHELATGCDVITIGEEEPEVKKPTVEQEASITIEVHVVEDCVGVADAKGEEYLSAADMEESDASCDEEDLDWDSETLAWAMGSDAEMRPKNSCCPRDQAGINYIAVAIDVATEKLAGYRLVQVGLAAADWLLGAVEEATTAELAPYVASVRRSGRKARRSGEKQTGAVRPVGMLTDAALVVASTLRIDCVLQLLGWKIQPVNQPCIKKVSATDSDEEAACLLEDLDSSDYNSDLDADYLPEEETVDTEEERLEFCSDIESCTTEED